jgi:hypothetical protein
MNTNNKAKEERAAAMVMTVVKMTISREKFELVLF